MGRRGGSRATGRRVVARQAPAVTTAATRSLTGLNIANSGDRSGRLKELDRVAGRILDEDLTTTRSAQRLVAEGDAGRAQALHGRVEVVHLHHDAVPATGLRLPAVRHRSGGRRGRSGEPQPGP